jgi:hypothetical protein
MQKRTAGVPGVFGDLQWVDSPDFGDEPEDRRIGSVYDVDPAPLSRVLGAILGIASDDLTERMRELANDDRDGPIHIIHLLGACEYAANQTGGGMPGAAFAPGDFASQLITAAVSGGALPASSVPCVREDSQLQPNSRGRWMRRCGSPSWTASCTTGWRRSRHCALTSPARSSVRPRELAPPRCRGRLAHTRVRSRPSLVG